MVDRESSTPMYLQLEEIIEDAIKSGVYKDGDKLPSENRLCLKYGVSRITVRQALNILEQKNLVYTVHGKGTFVKKLVIDQYLLKVVNFGDILLQKGFTGCTRIHSFQFKAENKQAEEILEAKKYGGICNLNLTGYVRKCPAVYYQSFFHEKTGLQIYQAALELEQKEAAFSSYDLYAKIGILIDKIDQKIMAVNAGKELSKLFNMPVGTAFLVLESKLYASGGLPVEYKIGYYPSNKFEFHLKRELG